MWLRSIFLETLRDYRVAILSWGPGIRALAPIVFASISGFLADSPDVRADLLARIEGPALLLSAQRAAGRQQRPDTHQRKYEGEAPGRLAQAALGIVPAGLAVAADGLRVSNTLALLAVAAAALAIATVRFARKDIAR